MNKFIVTPKEDKAVTMTIRIDPNYYFSSSAGKYHCNSFAGITSY